LSKVIKAYDMGYDVSSSPNGTLNTPKEVKRAALDQAAKIVAAASQRSRRILETANSQVTALVQSELANVEKIKASAKEDGFQKGYEDGFAQGQSQGKQEILDRWNNIFSSLSQGVEQLSQLRREVLEKSEPELIKIAILIAERLVKHKMNDPLTTLEISKALLEEIEDDSEVRLLLPQEIADLPAVKENINALEGAGIGVRFKIMPDSSLKPGDVRIETHWGWIDGRGSIRWSRLIRALQEEVHIDEVESLSDRLATV
jgi:flagellar assembly protein FliH